MRLAAGVGEKTFHKDKEKAKAKSSLSASSLPAAWASPTTQGGARTHAWGIFPYGLVRPLLVLGDVRQETPAFAARS